MMDLDETQQAAVEMALRSRVSILTGGPGTGKTTTVRALLAKLQETLGLCVALCAPTGKAARRLAEVTETAAYTVHRLLGLRGDHVETASLPADYVIVDESSMLDVHLAATLAATCHSGNGRILFVGDADQLPSVGPGRVLADLIESGTLPYTRLTKLHRAAEGSWICRNAPRIRDGLMPELGGSHDFAFWGASSAEEVERLAVELVASILPASGVNGSVVLTPRRAEVAASAMELNTLLQARLNPDDGQEAWKDRDRVIRAGDKVIQTRNDYELGVFNGETGVANGYHKTKEGLRLQVMFDGHDRPLFYTREQSWALQLAYALTIHRSQGSEWPWAVVICHSSHGRMLSRQLLYTAVTRAKQGVILLGDEQGIVSALKNVSPLFRRTGLIERLKAAAT